MITIVNQLRINGFLLAVKGFCHQQGAHVHDLTFSIKGQDVSDSFWLGLKILKTEVDPDDPHIGFVEFAAFYKNTEISQLHEGSIFIREAGNWYYLDGEFMAPLVFGRNDPCWCGSNKKYKKCHGR